MTQSSSPLGIFERGLSLWVALAMAGGVGAGVWVPAFFAQLARLEYFGVNLVVAVLIWVMIWPMMIQIDFASIRGVGQKPKALFLTLVINWLIKPLSMAALGLLFFEGLFADLVTPRAASEYIAGMILLGIAPCTAMVFVWSQLVNGDANYTLVQVSVNDLVMVVAFAPLATLLLGVTDLIVPWETLVLSVVLYVVIPLLAGLATRRLLLHSTTKQSASLAAFSARLKPFSIAGLLLMVVLLFGFQAENLRDRPEVMALIAVPLIIQSIGVFALAYGWGYLWRLPFDTAAPAALIGTSNFFELAVAVAISLFGLHSGAALATVVGVLVEVPVMLALVAVANRTRGHFPHTACTAKK